MSLEIKLAILAFVVIGVLGSLWGYGHHKYELGLQKGIKDTTAIYEAALTKQKNDAQAQLNLAIADKLETERKLANFKSLQESKDVDHQNTVASLRSQLVSAAGAAQRLRDPNATGCRASGGNAKGQVAASPSDSAGDGTQGDGLLSKPLTELLQQLTSDADDINNAYQSCRAERLNLEQTVTQDAP